METPSTRNAANGRVTKYAANNPIPNPNPTSHAPSPNTSANTRPGAAPNATRNPISRTRRATEYAINPNKPIPVNNNPNTPINPNKPAPTWLGKYAIPIARFIGFTSTDAPASSPPAVRNNGRTSVSGSTPARTISCTRAESATNGSNAAGRSKSPIHAYFESRTTPTIIRSRSPNRTRCPTAGVVPNARRANDSFTITTFSSRATNSRPATTPTPSSPWLKSAERAKTIEGGNVPR